MKINKKKLTTQYMTPQDFSKNATEKIPEILFFILVKKSSTKKNMTTQNILTLRFFMKIIIPFFFENFRKK